MNFRAKPGSDPLQLAGSRALFYPINIMPQISTKDSGILWPTKNAKASSNIAGYHSFSVISTPLDVQRMCRCPKKTFILTQKYHVSVSDMLLSLKKKTNKFQEPNLVLAPRKVLGQGLYFTP